MKNEKKSRFRSLRLVWEFCSPFVVYAYGFQVTKVNLAETKSEHRQQQLFRILRALARPNFFEYEKEVFEVRTPIMIPCPAEGFEPEPIEDTTSQPYMVVTPSCSDPRTNVPRKRLQFRAIDARTS
jgi:hypothetical protein